MLDDTREEVYSLTYDLRVYMIIFAIILIGLMIVFSFITRKQQKVSQKLASTIVKNNKTKESLYTAMFKDVLTDVNNRISFSMDADEMKVSSDTPYFFAMFNIADFSGVNSQYGNDIGDWLLVRTVDQLKQTVRGGKIYRTGSDEFVIAIKGDNKSVTKESVMDMVNEAMDKLNSKQSTPVGKHTFQFKAAIVKKSTKINGSVITALKDMVNKYNGQVGYADIDGK